MEQLAHFALTEPAHVPSRSLTPLRLAPTNDRIPGVETHEGGVSFKGTGWFEVLLTVDWGSTNRFGTRFSHTAIPDGHPLHSEAIDAGVLVDLSDGKQLLRGNTMFGPKGVDRIQLEVWQDSGTSLDVETASLEIRPLPNPPD
jgi:hypothetical protein